MSDSNSASQLEVAELRVDLARAAYQDAIKSFVKAINTQVQVVRERDAALARIAAVRALCVDAESEGDARVAIERVRAALDPTEGATP